MPTELEVIAAKLKEMQDLIEVASFYQKKMQATDVNIVRQETQYGKLSKVIGFLEE